MTTIKASWSQTYNAAGKPIDTCLPSVYQAGQWVYSLSVLTISILTGKLAADKVIKNRLK
jgi:hypothetical protein